MDEVRQQANVNTTAQKCALKCRNTFRTSYGPDGSLPGTFGKPGDVRRCDHGRVWTFTDESYGLDYWMRLSPVLSPIRYLRAIRALRRPDRSDTDD